MHTFANMCVHSSHWAPISQPTNLYLCFHETQPPASHTTIVRKSLTWIVLAVSKQLYDVYLFSFPSRWFSYSFCHCMVPCMCDYTLALLREEVRWLRYRIVFMCIQYVYSMDELISSALQPVGFALVSLLFSVPRLFVFSFNDMFS